MAASRCFSAIQEFGSKDYNGSQVAVEQPRMDFIA
jgi:hypothetical protein